MKCESCGHDNIDGARFCAKCGAAVPVAMISEADPLIGQVIGGRFHVTGVLGEGGMGIVYSGEQQMGTTVRKVAVKTLHAHLSKDASVMARFHREVGTVAQLEHPNTIKVYDFGTTKDGALYIAMEFVSGKSLADVILTQGAMAPDRVIHIMRQICGALDEAHSQGIVHRDLKPENIILTQRVGETDFVKVLDFGIAARTESADAQKEAKLTQQGMVLGTPPYMRPEQFTGKQLDARSDVYSLGIMAYEMLTGKLPFDAETPWEWATQHMTAAPKSFDIVAPAAHIPEGLRQAILKSLSKERTQRQDSARAFFAELSGGARITVEAGALAQPASASAGGYQATAAMPQVPGQAPGAPGGYAPTAMQPQMAPMGAPAPMMQAPGMGTPVAGIAMAPQRKSGGSNKGLVFGLGGVGAVLAIAIVIVIVRSTSHDDSGPITAPSTPGGGLTAAVVVPDNPPVDPAAAAATAAPTPEAAHPAAPHPGKVTGKGGAGNTPSTGAAGHAATTTPAAAAGDTASCGKCLSAAQAGDVRGAAAAYAKCPDPAAKSACGSALNGPARNAVKTLAFNGQCDQAKALIDAARSAGANALIVGADYRSSGCAKKQP